MGNTIHQVTTFAVSIGIALWRGWELALVMFALMPLLAASAALLMKVMVIGSAKLAKGYSTANVTSSETIANMRTVASFQAEERSHELYEALLETPTKVQIKTSTIGGLVGGIVACVMFCTCVATLLPSSGGLRAWCLDRVLMPALLPVHCGTLPTHS